MNAGLAAWQGGMAAPTTRAESRKLSVPFRALFGLYLVVPLAFLVYFADRTFLHGVVARRFPIDVQSAMPFALFFGMPHVTASCLSFADGDYLKRYWRRLIVPVTITVLVLLIVPPRVGLLRFYSIAYSWTIIHVVDQQVGLARSMVRAPKLPFQIWRLTGWALVLVLFVALFAPLMLKLGIGYFWWSKRAVTTLLLVTFAAAGWMSRTAPNRRGLLYLWGSQALLAACAFFWWTGYYGFVILLPRVVHDTTAFLFYVVHDHNRNADVPKNYLYRLTSRIGVPPWAATLLLSFGLALPMSYWAYCTSPPVYWVAILSYFLTFVHYLTDAFVWKSGSPHREHIRFS